MSELQRILCLLSLKIWWLLPLFLCILSFKFYIITFIQQYIHPSPFAEASLHFFIACGSEEKTCLGFQANIRTRVCLTAGRLTTNWAIELPGSLTELRCTLRWVSLHPTELCCTITELGCTLTEQCCTLTELRCTLTEQRCTLTELRCTLTEQRCTLTELRCTLTEQRCTLLSYDAPYWTIRFPYWAIRYTLQSYAAPYGATLHPTELRCTLLSYAAPYWAMLHPIWATLLV